MVCKQSEEPASATKCANELVEKKVAAVVAPLSSQGAVMLPIITGAKIPYIAQAPVSRAEFATPGAYMLSGGTIAVLAGQAKTRRSRASRSSPSSSVTAVMPPRR